MIVDVHGHLVPPELLAAIRAEKGRLPSLRLIEEQGGLALQFGSAKPTRPAMKGLSDVPGRIAWMDKNGIDRHVVGGWPDWLGNDLPPAEGEIWCKLINEALLAAAKAQPRFVPLAAVPMQDGARAASVLKSAMAAGFPGVMISTLPRGIGSVLDAPTSTRSGRRRTRPARWCISIQRSTPATAGSTITALPTVWAGSATRWWPARGSP